MIIGRAHKTTAAAAAAVKYKKYVRRTMETAAVSVENTLGGNPPLSIHIIILISGTQKITRDKRRKKRMEEKKNGEKKKREIIRLWVSRVKRNIFHANTQL